MSSIVLRVEGFEFQADDRNDEPRVLDLEIGRRAGLSRPRNVRKVIKTHLTSGFLNESDVRSVSERTRVGRISQLATSFWLTETGVLKLVTKLETPAAHALVGDMVRVYREAIRQLRAPAVPIRTPVATVEEWVLRLPPGVKVRDNPIWANELRQRIGFVAFVQGITWRKVEGWLRKAMGAVSYLQISGLILGEARRLLDLAGSNAVAIVRRAPSLPSTTKQQQQLFRVN